VTDSLTPVEGILRFRERQARKRAPWPPRPFPEPEPPKRKKRRYAARLCFEPSCRRRFIPTGSRARYCELCR
jgi:hypothetical protein